MVDWQTSYKQIQILISINAFVIYVVIIKYLRNIKRSGKYLPFYRIPSILGPDTFQIYTGNIEENVNKLVS